MVEITHHEHEDQAGKFIAMKDRQIVGEITYLWDEDQAKILVPHTEVDGAYEGQGIGKKLVERLIEFARERSVKVVPLCLFVKVMLDRKPEWQDVL